ncbi:MAG: hypothetical protein A3F10_07425 [Coxiella sp. RIFCSPHIGHO2_12_FULL_42_15]|nr:MAG: hypothetical protein A3F10_07425 [Coxiella sp. RIFCSPHIGHO2_12_FULL_42_15]
MNKNENRITPNDREKNSALHDFMQGLNLRFLKGPKKSQHYILFFCIACVCSLVVWAHFSKIDEVIRGVGKVIPSGKIQVIQHLEGGVIEKILVREGEKVTKGQVLMEIDDTSYTALLTEGLLKKLAIQAKIARLAAESKGQPFEIPSEGASQKQQVTYMKSEHEVYLADQAAEKNRESTAQNQLEQRQKESLRAQEKINKLNDSLKLVKEEYEMTKSLYQEGAAAKVEVLRSERQVKELMGDIADTQVAKAQSDSAVLEAESRLREIQTDFRSKAAKELVSAKAELQEQIQTNISLQDRATRTVLRSPVNGIVNVMNVNTIGGTVKPGETIIEIVPEGEQLLVEAKILPKDIAAVHIGEKAIVKLSAYDFVIYGGLNGTVQNVGADSITDKEGKTFYMATILTEKDYLGTEKKPLRILPGMMAQIDILAGKRSLLSYILKPLLRGSKEALRER